MKNLFEYNEIIASPSQRVNNFFALEFGKQSHKSDFSFHSFQLHEALKLYLFS